MALYGITSSVTCMLEKLNLSCFQTEEVTTAITPDQTHVYNDNNIDKANLFNAYFHSLSLLHIRGDLRNFVEWFPEQL